MFFRLNICAATEAAGDKAADACDEERSFCLRSAYGWWAGPLIVRFNRFRFKDGRETEGLEILRKHAAVVRAAEGCESVFLAQGQHPSTEVVVIALFRDEVSLRAFENRLRSDPSLGSDQFSLLRLTTRPPEMTEYEVRDER